MKKRKVLSFLTAAVLAVGAVPFSVIHAVAADETYVQGDVDMDGYITGHDAAMVSRYLNVDPELLSDQQKALADMNGDGVVDQSDADAIFAQKVCGLGVTFQKGERKNPNVTDVYMVRYYSYTSNYRDYKVVADHSLEKDDIDDIINQLESQQVISLRDFNLMDVNADGVVDEDDVEALICAISRAGAQVKPIYPAEDRYDMNLVAYFDVEPGDLDMDGYVTGHDAAMATRFLYVDPTLLTKDRQILGDMNGDGVFDQADADLIHEKQTYALCDVRYSRKSEKETISSTAVMDELYMVALQGVKEIGRSLGITNKGDKFVKSNNGKSFDESMADRNIDNELYWNLMDVDADGDVDLDDVYATMVSCAFTGSGASDSSFFSEGRYDLNFDLIADYARIHNVQLGNVQLG